MFLFIVILGNKFSSNYPNLISDTAFKLDISSISNLLEGEKIFIF